MLGQQERTRSLNTDLIRSISACLRAVGVRKPLLFSRIQFISIPFSPGRIKLVNLAMAIDQPITRSIPEFPNQKFPRNSLILFEHSLVTSFKRIRDFDLSKSADGNDFTHYQNVVLIRKSMKELVEFSARMVKNIV